MKQGTALWLSVALSIFLLAVLSGVLSAAARGRQNASVDGLSPEAQQALADQQAAYSLAIEQANQQLMAAQGMIDSMQPSASSVASELTTQVSADDALGLALAAAQNGAKQAGDAELVNFEGTIAYEVPFDIGNIYVDAVTGEVLNNGTQFILPPEVSPEQAARIAADYLGNPDVYKVELDDLNDQTVYKVKFVNGDVVFVSVYGELQLVRLAAPGSGSGSGYDDDDHDDDGYEDHEEEHEDD